MTTTADPKSPLRLFALDEEDLAILSANMQDATIAVADLAYVTQDKRFALVGKRFDWVQAAAGGCERCATGLHFERVLGVARSGIEQGDGERVLNLLSIHFEPTQAPTGHVILTFSAHAAIRLTVECIEAQLRDLGPRWPCDKQPAHPDET